MKRLEIIHLRLIGSRPPGFIDEIRKSITNQDSSVKISIYHHAAVKTDLAIHLHLEAGIKDPHVTELGLRLVSALQQYGMVEHTVWLEEKEQDNEESSGINF